MEQYYKDMGVNIKSEAEIQDIEQGITNMGMSDPEDRSIRQLSGPLGERTLNNLIYNHSAGPGRGTDHKFPPPA